MNDFYTSALLWSVGVIIAVGVIIYYYNKKWVPMQQAKGVPAQPLSRLLSSMFKNGYTTHVPFQWLSAKPFHKLPKKLMKLGTLRNTNLLLNAITIALLALQNPTWWAVPILQTLLNIVAYAPQHTGRNAMIGKMAKASYKKLGWGQAALISPWRYVKVQEWDDVTPVRVQLHIGADLDMTLPSTRESFQRSFNATVSEKNNWSYEWKTAEGCINLTPIALLPERADYPGAGDFAWNEFPIGIGENGIVSYDISKYPHVLVAGTTGSGKSVLQTNITFHCIQHNDMWRFLGVDLKRVELNGLKKYDETVMGIATELEDAVEVIRYAQRVMNTRYKQMEEAGVTHFLKMVDPKTGKTKERAILVMIDEAAMFMGTEGVKTDEGKARDELHGEAVGIIGALARLGRASGVHLLLATQRPDATFIPGEVKANLDVRIAAGRLDATPSTMVLDSMAATLLPGDVKGRGVIRYAGINQEFQGFFAEKEWIDEWLMQNPGVEPNINPAPGQVTTQTLGELDDDIDFENGILELEADIMDPGVADFALQAMEELKDADEDVASDTKLKPKKKLGFKKKAQAEEVPELDQMPDFTDDELPAHIEDAAPEAIQEEALVPLARKQSPAVSKAGDDAFNRMLAEALTPEERKELASQMDIPVEESSLEGIPSFEDEDESSSLSPSMAMPSLPMPSALTPGLPTPVEKPTAGGLPTLTPPAKSAGLPIPPPPPARRSGGPTKLIPPKL